MIFVEELPSRGLTEFVGTDNGDTANGNNTSLSRLSVSPNDSSINTTVRQFHEDGFVVIENCFPMEIIDNAFMHAMNNFHECIQHIESKNLHFGIGIKNGFKEIVQRHPSRFEMPYKMDSPVFDFVLKHELLMKVVESILETKDFIVANRSCVNSKPGTDYQGWHTDGPHISITEYMKSHVFNMFIPLVDVTIDKGPTEFRPGSQRYTNNLAKGMLLAKIKKQIRPIEAPIIRKGSVLLFDYRVLHRGGANVSDSHRPVLVFTFAKPWYRDNLNFPARSLYDNQEKMDQLAESTRQNFHEVES